MTAPGAPAVKREAPSSEDSGDWLADIFDSVDDEVIGNLPPGASLSLPAEAIAALEASGGQGLGVADGSSQSATAAKKRGRDAAGEPRGSAKVKKSAREKRRRDALNDRFMGLSALLDPGSGEELKTDKATIVTEAARVIKSLREELSTLTASLEEAVNSNAACAERLRDTPMLIEIPAIVPPTQSGYSHCKGTRLKGPTVLEYEAHNLIKKSRVALTPASPQAHVSAKGINAVVRDIT